jgi:hypothetical protein
VLPDGCPFVIGGGLVRDAIMGGRPNDIDVWLPSNITVPDCDAFCAHLVRTGYGVADGFQGQVIFRGPGSDVREVEAEPILGGFHNAEYNAENYGDVHNHWVIEVENTSEEFAHPKVNIMRNMARWTGDAPAFFTEIMRNFDLDLCMYFIGYMPGQNSINTVIMPRHLRIGLMSAASNGARTVQTHINEVYWNQARLNNTSEERIRSRVVKMNQKYMLRLPEAIEDIRMIPTADIVAEPVQLSFLMRYFNANMGYGNAALPQMANRLHEADYNRLWAEATARFHEWQSRVNPLHTGVGRAITPMAFMRWSTDAGVA